MFTVRPDLQAAGIGKAALALIEAWVKEYWKLPRIEMTVIHTRCELVAWYQRRGYALTGRKEPFPYGDPRVGTALVPDLEMLVLEKRLA
jgi:hypothetical protein